MGVDEALLASLARGRGATLRFYTWAGPWLSLGYGQSVSDERRAACRSAGVGIVRRSTGGGAVLHGADLTYALVAPDARLPPGLQASYAFLNDALLEALGALGVPVERSRPRSAAPPVGFDCFAAPARDEICAGGLKLAGSAQRRAGGGVLQHGSIRLRPDPARAREASGMNFAAATSLAELGHPLEESQVRDACIQAFEGALGVRFERGVLDPSEDRLAGNRESRIPTGGLKRPQRPPITMS
jgi:lipoate-protein ligase A